jgi:CARDB
MKKFLMGTVAVLGTAAMVLTLAAGDADAAKKKKKVLKKPAAAAPAAAEPAATAVAGPDAPDITIIPEQTEITMGGCADGDELFTTTVAVKNSGRARAERLLVEPIVAVYIPEMLDMKDEKLVPNSLAPKEIFSTDAHVGKGKIKNARGLVGKRRVYIVVDPYNKIPEGNEQNNILVREVNFVCK